MSVHVLHYDEIKTGHVKTVIKNTAYRNLYLYRKFSLEIFRSAQALAYCVAS